MSDELDTFISTLTGKLAAMANINQAPEHPPESLNDLPMVVTRITNTDVTYSAGRGVVCVHNLYADVLLARSVLPHDEERARAFILLGIEVFAGNVTMDGTCEHCILTGIDGPGNISGAGYSQPVFGLRYFIEAKIRYTSISVSA